MRSSHRPPIIAAAFLILIIAMQLRGYVGVRAQTPSPQQLEQGARLFADNCAVCHGPKGEGRVGATLAKNWPSIRPDLEIKNTIERGVAGSPMPAWSQANGGPLSEDEIDALVAYILGWESGAPFQVPPTPTAYPRPVLTPPPNVLGDPNQGARIFDQNCAVCHGPNGEGRIGARLAKAWPALQPGLSARVTIENGIPGTLMPAWSQANGGPLSETEINDLVAFLLTLPAAGQLLIEPTPTTVPSPFFSGWGGIIFAVILFAVLVTVAVLLQTRRT